MSEIKATEIEMVSVNELIPHPKNMHEHPKEQIDRLCKIIEYQGFRTPLTVQKGTNLIVTGHGRLMAAKQLNMTHVPVSYQEFESEDMLYAHIVADNAIGKDTWASLDLGKINMELENLGPMDIDLLGIKDFVVEPLDKLDPMTDEDDVPEVSEPITKRGDIWLLGNHRVMCGDSTMIDDVEKLMSGEKIELVHTDPPYGIGEKGDRTTRGGEYAGQMYKDFKDDSVKYAVDAFNLVAAFDIPRQVWWGANYYSHTVPQTNNWLVWDKRVEENQKDLNSDCELAYVKSKWSSVRIFRHLWKGMIKASEHGQKRVHPTQKPIALVEWVFDYYKSDFKNVMDLFLGSGSTLIACEKTNRNCFGMELDEHYCDVIINRWQNYTGKKAILESNNKTYDELKNG